MGRENVFNLRVVGIGGKGVVKLSNQIAEAALNAGIHVTVVERPRSAMRLSPITCDIIFNQENLASFIAPGDADVVLSTEPLDGLMNAAYYLKKGGLALMNSFATPSLAEIVSGTPDKRADECRAKVEEFGGKILAVDAVAASVEETGNELGTNYYLLGVLCAAEPRLPVCADQIRAVLKGSALQCFEKGIASL